MTKEQMYLSLLPKQREAFNVFMAGGRAMYLGQAGSGKTHLAFVAAHEYAYSNPVSRVCILGETYSQNYNGGLRFLPSWEKGLLGEYLRASHEFRLTNGSIICLRDTSDPQKISELSLNARC